MKKVGHFFKTVHTFLFQVQRETACRVHKSASSPIAHEQDREIDQKHVAVFVIYRRFRGQTKGEEELRNGAVVTSKNEKKNPSVVNQTARRAKDDAGQTTPSVGTRKNAKRIQPKKRKWYQRKRSAKCVINNYTCIDLIIIIIIEKRPKNETAFKLNQMKKKK